jgi:hypothetical protein
MTEKFRVWTFFVDGSYSSDGNWIDAESAVTRAKGITESVGARMGIIDEVRIVDRGDDTVFHWTKDKGVVFPPRV